jgi:cytochrome P450
MKQQTLSPFASPLYRSNPYPTYAQIRADAPAYKTILPTGVEVYVVTRYADVVAGLKDGRLVKNIYNARPAGTLQKLGIDMQRSNMLKTDPPEHTRLRGLVKDVFTPKYINQLREHVQQIADDLLDGVQSQGQMDFISDFAFPLPITVISEMLGVPVEDHLKFRRWSGELIASGTLSSESFHIQRGLLPMVRYVRRLVAGHRKQPREDVVGYLINAETDGDRLNDREIISTTILLLIAGHETTVNLIGNGMLALLQNPEQLELLQQRPELIRPAVEELLRYVNPVQMVNRYAAEDLEIGGVPIPKGSHLMLVVAAADHDPAYHANPEQLDVAHTDARHMAFGQGIHYCLGAPLARLEGEIAFATVLRRLPNIRLACDPHKLVWRPAIELRGLQSLPVTY